MRKLILLALLGIASLTANAQNTNTLKSPDGTVAVKVTTAKDISYSVSIDNHDLLADCKLALTIDGKTLGASPKLKGVKRSTINTTVRPVVPMKNAVEKNHCNVMTMAFDGFSVEFRAYDYGVAYRFITKKKGTVKVNNELVDIRFAGDYTADMSKTNSFRTSCESFYRRVNTKYFSEADQMTYLPILINADNNYKILISEADLKDYPGMFLEGTGQNGMKGLFPPYPLEFAPDGDRAFHITKAGDYIATTSGSRSFPWRYFMISREDKQIPLNNLTCVLSSPCELKETSWIRPGLVSWDWWNHRMIWNVDFKSGVNNDTYKYYIDFAAKYGVPYIIMDEGWAKQTVDPYTTIPEIDLPELIKYGKSKGVDIILWMTWVCVDKNFDVFEKYSKMGIAGFKIDFMDRQDQWMVNYYERVIKEAAKYHMVIDFHGAYKPSGLEQRYPNLLSYEGVRGLENNETCTPENSMFMPFMRNAVGAMDFTPGAFNSAQPEECESTWPNPQTIGTRAYHMATFVVFESGTQMLADSPTRYYAEENCTRFITSVPVTWDETRIVDAKSGQYIITAKRKGSKWYIGAITGKDPQDLTLPLDFLGAGSHKITYFEDGPNSSEQALEYRQHEGTVDKSTTMQLKLVRNGGWCAVIE